MMRRIWQNGFGDLNCPGDPGCPGNTGIGPGTMNCPGDPGCPGYTSPVPSSYVYTGGVVPSSFSLWLAQNQTAVLWGTVGLVLLAFLSEGRR